jgi:hypothetical protein
MVGFCEHGNELSGPIKGGEFNGPRKFKLFKEGPVPQNVLDVAIRCLVDISKNKMIWLVQGIPFGNSEISDMVRVYSKIVQ